MRDYAAIIVNIKGVFVCFWGIFEYFPGFFVWLPHIHQTHQFFLYHILPHSTPLHPTLVHLHISMLSFKQFLLEVSINNQNQQTSPFDPNTWQYGPSIPKPDVSPRPANQDEIERRQEMHNNPLRRRDHTHPASDNDGDGIINIDDKDDDNDGWPDKEDPWPFDPSSPQLG